MEQRAQEPCQVCTSVEKAAYNGHLDCMRCLQKPGTSFSEEVLVKASCLGHQDCLLYALESGAVNVPELPFHLAYVCNLEALRYLCENKQDYLPDWDDSGFADFRQFSFAPEIKQYLTEVEESWKQGWPVAPKPAKQ